MASESLRVLGVACASHMGEQLPTTQKDFTFQFLGLVGLVDPLLVGRAHIVFERGEHDLGVSML